MKFNSAKILSVCVALLGIAGTFLAAKADEANREELKKEILEEVRKSK